MEGSDQIGFIGQGYVGESYADNFESRGFQVVRYSLEEEYRPNKEAVHDCHLIFVAVPTPTLPTGFDDSIIRSVLQEIPSKRTVVIKSTLQPGLTNTLQSDFPDLTILYSPEFLSEKTAKQDVTNPFLNVVGLPIKDSKHEDAARRLLSILPSAKQEILCEAVEAELIKYAHNTLGYTKVVFMNLLYNTAEKIGADWSVIKQGMLSDPMIAPYHLDPVHKGGRGAGGKCLIKDFESFVRFYEAQVSDSFGHQVLKSLRAKNLDLLKDTQKGQEIVKEVYGESLES